MRRVLLVAGVILAACNSVHAANYYFEGTEDNLWSNLNNWTVDAVVPAVLPGPADNVRIRSSCLLDYDAGIINSLQVGSGGAGELIVDGGRIDAAKGTTPADMGAIGWDAPGTLTLLNNGEVIIRNDTTIGCWANKGVVNVESGRFYVPGLLVMSIYADNGVFADSEINIYGGSVESYYFEIKGGVTDICRGRLLPWYDNTRVATYIADQKIVGFGGQGTLTFNTVPVPRIVTAEHNMHPSPDFDEVVPIGDVTLSWDNIIEPNHPGAQLVVDVWFGTDPNKSGDDYVKVAENLNFTGQGRSSVTISVPEVGLYYWQVDTDNGDADPNKTESTLFTFATTNDLPPHVDAGVDMITWVNEPVQLNPTIIDDGVTSLTYAWTTTPEAQPNVIFSDPTTAAPVVTIDEVLGAVTLTLTVQDGFNSPVSDTVVINVYNSACSAAIDGPGLDPVTQQFDLYFDCRIDLLDFAALAEQWLNNYELTGPIPVP